MSKPPLSSVSVPHLAFLDAVRGIAVVGVVLVHALLFYSKEGFDPAAPLFRLFASGQYGVQLFFMASAVTLAYSHDRRRAEPNAVGRFWIRRALRIAPLYWFGVVLYSLVWRVEGDFPGVKPIVLNLLFVHPYSTAAFNSVPPGGWSIGVETQFYAVLPLVFLFVKDKKSAAWFLAAALGVCLATLFALKRLGHYPAANSFCYYWLPNQLPVFAAGLLLYHVVKPRMTQGVPADAARPSAGLLASIAALAVLAIEKRDSPYYHLVVAVPLFSLVAALAHSPWKAIVSRPLRALGQVSFSVYIVHFLLCDLVQRLWPDALRLGNAGFALYYAVVLGLSYGLALLTKRLIEDPGVALAKPLIAAVEARAVAT